jgi:hypothetical protein
MFEGAMENAGGAGGVGPEADELTGARSVPPGKEAAFCEETGMAPTDRLGLAPGRRAPTLDELDGGIAQVEIGEVSACGS